MFVVLNPEGYFVSVLHEPDAENQSRADVVEVEDRDGLTTAFRYVNGAWIAPEFEAPAPTEEAPYVMSRPARNTI